MMINHFLRVLGSIIGSSRSAFVIPRRYPWRSVYTTLCAALSIVAAFVGCRAEHSAEYPLPGTNLVVAVSLVRSNPPLAEYDRTLSFGPAGGPFQEIELFAETGRYALVNLYKIGPTEYLVKTEGNHQYRLDLSAGMVVPRQTTSGAVPKGAEFIGAFDFDASHAWRFLPGWERPERKVGKLYAPP